MADQPNTASASRLDPTLRLQLSLMMLLQYALWGAWWSVLGKYIAALDYSNAQIGRIYATTAIASIISPLVFGQIADRWVSTQYLLAALHLAGAAALFLATRFTEFTPIYAFVLAWAILYVPTISLTNSLSFHHIRDAARHFPTIRVFGTIGWIVAGLAVTVVGLDEKTVQPMLLGAGVGVVLGVYCLFLPKTPPKGDTGAAFPPIEALGMLKDAQFAFFIAVSFLISMALAAYFAFCSVFLEAEPLNIKSAAGIMTIGQFSEMLLLPLLPFFIRTIGMKWTLLLGMLAWSVRYGIFALGQPTWLVIASLTLHGVCYDFFFVAGYIHTDNKAHPDIRASAQALFNFVTMGVGMLIGNEVFGRIVDAYKTDGVVDWRTVWSYPCIGALLVVVLFAAVFKSRKPAASVAA